MKGMMDLLERAGLVRRVDGADGLPSDGVTDAAAARGVAEVAPTANAAHAQGDAPHSDAVSAVADTTGITFTNNTTIASTATGMTLEQIYATAAVPPCAFPAERLLRLIDGLKAMDAGMRRQTILALDAADDTWSLADPQRDAAAKVAAIEQHALSIRAGVALAEQETTSRLGELQQLQETSVAEIRRQISDLEGLLAREIARGAQETAALEAALKTLREAANRELGKLAHAASTLSGLIAQFAAQAPTPMTSGKTQP